MFKRLIGAIALVSILCIIQGVIVSAQTTQSPNFRLDESVIGSGGLVQSSSNNFQADSSTGDVAVGESSSGNFQTQSGSKTTNDPALSFAITNSAANFGSFTASSATLATATFSVSNYTSYGYVVQIIGNPPSNGSHVIDAMNTTGPSQAGVEQFGINIVANTSPVTVGANPDNGQFGQGVAAANYNTSNSFRFVSGETIASAPKSSGMTNYTISYLVNVASLTPGGQYTGSQTLVVTGTY